MTNHVRGYRFLLMNDAAFNLMSKDQQKIFVDTWKEISRELEDEYVEMDKKYLEILQEQRDDRHSA